MAGTPEEAHSRLWENREEEEKEDYKYIGPSTKRRRKGEEGKRSD